MVERHRATYSSIIKMVPLFILWFASAFYTTNMYAYIGANKLDKAANIVSVVLTFFWLVFSIVVIYITVQTVRTSDESPTQPNTEEMDDDWV